MVVQSKNRKMLHDVIRENAALLEVLGAIPEPPEAPPHWNGCGPIPDSELAAREARVKFLADYAAWFTRFQAVQPGERITINADAWECLCGNRNDLDGFDPVNRDGQPTTHVPPWSSPFWQCRQCGRVVRESDGFVLKGDTTEAEIAAVVKLAQQQIRDDVAKGVVPADVPSFAALHEYVDANLYGEAACQYATQDCAEIERVMAPAQDRLHQWILSGALRPAPAPAEASKPLPTMADVEAWVRANTRLANPPREEETGDDHADLEKIAVQFDGTVLHTGGGIEVALLRGQDASDRAGVIGVGEGIIQFYPGNVGDGDVEDIFWDTEADEAQTITLLPEGGA